MMEDLEFSFSLKEDDLVSAYRYYLTHMIRGRIYFSLAVVFALLGGGLFLFRDAGRVWSLILLFYGLFALIWPLVTLRFRIRKLIRKEPSLVSEQTLVFLEGAIRDERRGEVRVFRRVKEVFFTRDSVIIQPTLHTFLVLPREIIGEKEAVLVTFLKGFPRI